MNILSKKSRISTAKLIVDNLVKDKENEPEIEIPTYLQINNYKNNNAYRETPSSFTFGDLFKVLHELETEPEDDDEPYVINKQIKVDDDDNPSGPPIKNKQFRFSFSTKRLLSILSHYAMHHTITIFNPFGL